MAELPGRDAWLAAVGRQLDAAPDSEAEVLEELSAHLDDRVAEALARGVDPAEAERRARNRLGDPATLGRAIRKARRAKRSALALVGGGAFSFAYFSVTGIVLSVAFLGVISGLTVTVGSWALSTEWWR
ncbi:MAG: permease prefix domain 1-containing protein, partial [Candidatus Limnocylindrales bacterium]